MKAAIPSQVHAIMRVPLRASGFVRSSLYAHRPISDAFLFGAADLPLLTARSERALADECNHAI